MDMVLSVTVTITLIVFMAVAVFVSYCLGALTIVLLDHRWRTRESKKEIPHGDSRPQS